MAGIAYLITRLLCRRTIAVHRQPSYLLAVIGSFCAPLIMPFMIFGSRLFTRHFWTDLFNDDRLPAVIFVPLVFGVCFVVSLVPALLAVCHCRHKLRNENHVA